MNRPEHVPFNSSEGIRRINYEQEKYDEDPESYEREKMLEKEIEVEERQREIEAEQDYYNRLREEEYYQEQEESDLPF